MIAEHGSIFNLLNENNILNILIEGLNHKSYVVKRNIAEALAFLLKDSDVRESIQDDQVLQALVTEFKKAKD